MARPRTITNEQILQTMRATVLELGARVSLDVVAQRLNVTAPALLKRFGTRQALMLEALRPPEDPGFIERFESGPDDHGSLSSQLTERFADLWEFFEEVIPCVIALRESGIPPEKLFENSKHKNPLRAIKAIQKWVAAAHDQGLAFAPEAESIATAMLGAVQMRAFTAHVANLKFSARSNRAYLDSLVDFFGRALAPKPKRPSNRREVA